MLPYQFDELGPTEEEFGRSQFDVETVYLLPILSKPKERLRLNLEEAYELNGEKRCIERAVIHGDGGVDPVLVVRDGELFLEDAKKQKSPLQLYREYMAAKEEEEDINNMQKRFMFGNFNALRADRKLGEGNGGGDDDALDAEFEVDEIENDALKDFEEGPDVPESDLD